MCSCLWSAKACIKSVNKSGRCSGTLRERGAFWDGAEGIRGACRDWRASSDPEAVVRNREQTGLGVDGRTQRGLGTAATNSNLAVCDQAPLP